MSDERPRKGKAKLVATQTKTVAQQWSGVIAESFGLRPPTPQVSPPAIPLESAVWHSTPLGAVWLGHATTLLRVGGLNILTDPHLDDRAGVSIGKRKIGRRRAVAVPLSAEDMPPVDVLMLSHAHMDHWDMASLLRLSRQPWAHKARVVIPTGTRDLLPAGFGEAIELPWGASVSLPGSGGDVSLSALRPRHWGARFLWDRRRGYNAYVLDAGPKRLVFGGDTAMTDAFDVLGQTGNGVELAVMGIGSYEPWRDQHATPEEVAEMARRMNARLLMPIHHATFMDSNVPLDEPLRRLLTAWEPSRIVCSRIGDVWTGDTEGGNGRIVTPG